MRAALLVVAALTLAGCASHEKSPPPLPVGTVVNAADPNVWEIGPIIDGNVVSVGMPLHPTATADGWALDIPIVGTGSAHYITMASAPLAGKTKITMTFRVEGANIVPKDEPQASGMLTLYFEQAGLCWTIQCESMRWYATFPGGNVVGLKPGAYTLTAPLEAEWTAVMTSKRSTNPFGFLQATAQTGRVGFVLGGGSIAVGHGVSASGPGGRIVVTSYKVE